MPSGRLSICLLRYRCLRRTPGSMPYLPYPTYSHLYSPILICLSTRNPMTIFTGVSLFDSSILIYWKWLFQLDYVIDTGMYHILDSCMWRRSPTWESVTALPRLAVAVGRQATGKRQVKDWSWEPWYLYDGLGSPEALSYFLSSSCFPITDYSKQSSCSTRVASQGSPLFPHHLSYILATNFANRIGLLLYLWEVRDSRGEI